ncbi:LysR family transcriptional regulator [Kalymmatonema gypsitolerans NIES-4073]|nr:LysR family transcriptional regulator [Scytonema sp. NIES-4073]
MNLDQLRCFVVLAKTLNFRRAAEQLHMAQPSLTRLISRMEKELGVQLVNRTTRQVKLTKAGEVLVTEAQAVLTRTEQAIRTVRQTAIQESGRLGVAFTDKALYTVVPKVLSIFRDRFPHVELEILEACTENQVQALQVAKVDVGFLHPPLRAQFLALLPIYAEPMLLALPVDSPLSLQTTIAWSDLVNETLILHKREEGPVLYDYIIQQCEQNGFTPQIIHRTPEQTFLGLVTAKLGVSFATPSMRQMKNPGVVFVAIADNPPTLEYALAWRQEDTSPLVEAFRQVVEEVGILNDEFAHIDCSKERNLTSYQQVINAKATELPLC